MKCEKCKESDDCVIYQSWLNEQNCCCPFQIEDREKEEIQRKIVKDMRKACDKRENIIL